MSSLDEPSWRVYLREWLIVYSAEGNGPECWDHFASRYAGRVRDEDRRVRVVPGGQQLELRLWNLAGEFRDRPDAEQLSFAGEHVCVQRGSSVEQELLDYGRKMLPDTAATDGTGGRGEEERI